MRKRLKGPVCFMRIKQNQRRRPSSSCISTCSGATHVASSVSLWWVCSCCLRLFVQMCWCWLCGGRWRVELRTWSIYRLNHVKGQDRHYLALSDVTKTTLVAWGSIHQRWMRCTDLSGCSGFNIAASLSTYLKFNKHDIKPLLCPLHLAVNLGSRGQEGAVPAHWSCYSSVPVQGDIDMPPEATEAETIRELPPDTRTNLGHWCHGD